MVSLNLDRSWISSDEDENDNDYDGEDQDDDKGICCKWKKPERGEPLPICLEKTPLEVKTCENMGKVANFKLMDENKDCAGSLKIIFTGSCVKYDGEGFYEPRKFPALPSGDIKIWQIMRDSGITIIKCNGEEVATIDPYTDSSIYDSAKKEWKKNNVKFVKFCQYDEATKTYRNSPDRGNLLFSFIFSCL